MFLRLMRPDVGPGCLSINVVRSFFPLGVGTLLSLQSTQHIVSTFAMALVSSISVIVGLFSDDPVDTPH